MKMSEASCSSSSRCAGKYKCQFQDTVSTKKLKLTHEEIRSPSQTLSSDRPQDCRCGYCNGGSSFLPVRHPSQYDGTARFAILYECGCFSVTGQRLYMSGKSQLKYIHLPQNVLQVSLDLNVAYESAIRRVYSIINEKLDFLLNWIIEEGERLSKSDPGSCSSMLLKSMPDIHFFCNRGLMTLIMTTPYEKQDDWTICATKFKGTIYLAALPTERKLTKEANKTDREKLMCSWGYKFEQYLTKSHSKGHPEPPNVPVNENEEYCGVFKSRLSNHILVYAAEIDGVNVATSENPNLTTMKYVELKTSRIITTEYQDISFCKYKTVKWWAQCVLASVTKLHCGFRDDSGIVQYVRSFSLPDLVTLGKGLWSRHVCFNFANCFLSYVKNVVIKDDPNVIYKFDWAPGSPITYRELHSATTPEFQILPEWYTSRFVP